MIFRPDLPLPSYLAGIVSHNHQWLTQLTLLNITIPRTALIQLSGIFNLSVLTIGPGVLATDIGVDDGLLRTWSRAASTGAFSMLRALALRDQPHVTARAFSYLEDFPALSIFAIERVSTIGLPDKVTMVVQDWTLKIGQELRAWLSTVGDSGERQFTWDAISEAFFRLGGQYNKQETTMAKSVVAIMDALPSVHLAIGGQARDAYVDYIVGAGSTHVWHRDSTMAAAAPTTGPKLPQLPLPNWSGSSTVSSNSTKVEPQNSRTADSLISTSIPMTSAQLIPQKRPPQDQDHCQDQPGGPTMAPSKKTRKKMEKDSGQNRAIRPSKHQNLNDLLLDFST